MLSCHYFTPTVVTDDLPRLILKCMNTVFFCALIQNPEK
jgi:hypothetical protein